MNGQPPSQLQERAIRAAEAVLQRDGSVGPLELLQQMGLLAFAHVQGWRRGLEYYPNLERWIQGSPEKLRKTFAHFEAWAKTRGLKPFEAAYQRSGARGAEPLRVTETGDPEREKFFRTHYAPGNLPEKKAEKLAQKLTKAPELVVFQTVSESVKCSECSTELHRGNFLFMEKGQPLCLACADLDHLVFLPRGDMALSRRARKHSPLSAVVVRFKRTRKRYERQGLLVTPAALAQAEAECTADAAERAARREQDAARRLDEDRELVAAMAQAIRAQYPHCPPAEAQRIAAHTAERGSGRVGRSASGRALMPAALDLAVIAFIRHNHTNYDTLLMQGVERQEARDWVREQVDRVLAQWAGR